MAPPRRDLSRRRSAWRRGRRARIRRMHLRAVGRTHVHRGIRVQPSGIRMHPAGRRLAGSRGVANAIVLLVRRRLRRGHASIRRVDSRRIRVDARRRTSRILRIGGRRRRRWIRRRRGFRMNCSRYSHDGCGGEEFQKHVTASLCGVGPKIHSAPKSGGTKKLAPIGLQAMDREAGLLSGMSTSHRSRPRTVRCAELGL